MKNDNEHHFRDEMICFWWFWRFTASVFMEAGQPQGIAPTGNYLCESLYINLIDIRLDVFSD